MGVPLDTEEARFASWLATLDDPKAHPASRAEALKTLSQMYSYSRQNEVSLLAQLESAQRENGLLRAYRARVSAITLDTLGGVVLVQTSGQPSIPPLGLRLVKPEGA